MSLALSVPRPTSIVAAPLALPSVSFFGRTLAEYLQFFDLRLDDLDDCSILDVAAGPSSFTAECHRRGIDAVAVDPLYGCPATSLAAYVQIDYDRMFTQLRRRPEAVTLRADGTGFASLDEAEASRRAAADRFLRDYESGFLHGRYVGAKLPHLPFFDGQFDRVLCAHFLFVYADRFDYAFHLAACRELARVSRGDVRLHPVCGLDGRPYHDLARLRADLAADGIRSTLIRPDYAFFVGADQTLILNPTRL